MRRHARAHDAGFACVELHMAHGYLLHEFLSPLANHRDDAYGGDLEDRLRLPLEVAGAVREAWPQRAAAARAHLGHRLGGGRLDAGGVRALRRPAARARRRPRRLLPRPAAPDQAIALEPGYQVPFAAEVRARTGVATGAVGLITEPRRPRRS